MIISLKLFKVMCLKVIGIINILKNKKFNNYFMKMIYKTKIIKIYSDNLNFKIQKKTYQIKKKIFKKSFKI